MLGNRLSQVAHRSYLRAAMCNAISVALCLALIVQTTVPVSAALQPASAPIAALATACSGAVNPGGGVDLPISAKVMDAASLGTIVPGFQVDLFSSAALTTFPMVIPQGRKGVSAGLSLFYRSDGRNSLVGTGWNFDLGYVQRSTQKGIPAYDSSDVFVFGSNGANSELISIGNDEYRAKVEGGFQKFLFQDNTWQVWDRNGMAAHLILSSLPLSAVSRVPSGGT